MAADANTLSETLKKLNYGIYVVTSRKPAAELVTRNHDWVSASIVSWAMQVSMEPQLVAIAVQKDSNLRETIEKSHDFALHILSEEDRGLVKEFTGSVDFTDDEINGHHYDKGASGAPILKEGLGVVEFKWQETIATGGDHVIFIGKPVAAQLRKPKATSIAIEETRFEYGGKEQKG